MNARQRLIQEIRLIRNMMKLEVMLFGYVTPYTANTAVQVLAGFELVLSMKKE
jgi:hypothetical protein